MRQPSIAVVDYQAGNVTSVMKALNAAGGQAFLAVGPGDIYDADAVVVPGVGHFAATGAIHTDMRDALKLRAGTKPMLGVCLGMQFLFAGSEESPEHRGLGLLAGTCRRLSGAVKVPHVGWNTATIRRESPLLEGVDSGAYFYFTHSYAGPIVEATVAVTTHGSDFPAIVDGQRHVYGVQFHPEKSGADGLRLLRNFVNLC